MKIRVLESARRDLRKGFRFYEAQRTGAGHYFIDTLYEEIDSLAMTGGIHPIRLGYHRLLSHIFPYAIYYRPPETNSQFMLCSIAAAVPPGSNTDSAEVDNPGEDTEAQKRYCRRGCKMMF